MKRGDPLGFINILSVAKYQKIRRGEQKRDVPGRRFHFVVAAGQKVLFPVRSVLNERNFTLCFIILTFCIGVRCYILPRFPSSSRESAALLTSSSTNVIRYIGIMSFFWMIGTCPFYQGRDLRNCQCACNVRDLPKSYKKLSCNFDYYFDILLLQLALPVFELARFCLLNDLLIQYNCSRNS